MLPRPGKAARSAAIHGERREPSGGAAAAAPAARRRRRRRPTEPESDMDGAAKLCAWVMVLLWIGRRSAG